MNWKTLRVTYSSGALDLEDSVRFGRSSTGLCGVPYMDLLEQASLESSRSLQVPNSQCFCCIKSTFKSLKAVKLTYWCNIFIYKASIDLDSESGYDSSAQEDSGAEDVASLWVEKFRPKSYLQVN